MCISQSAANVKFWGVQLKSISWYDRKILPLWSDMFKIGQKIKLQVYFTWSQMITHFWDNHQFFLWSSIKKGCKMQLPIYGLNMIFWRITQLISLYAYAKELVRSTIHNLVENQNWSITSQIWLIYFKFNYSEFPQYAYHLTDHCGGFRVSPYMAKLLGHTLFHCCWSHLHENAIGIRHVVTF